MALISSYPLLADDIFGFEKVVLNFNENLIQNFFYQCNYQNYAANCAGNDEFSLANVRFECKSEYYPTIQIDAVVGITCNSDAPVTPKLDQFRYRDLKMMEIKYGGDMKVTTNRNQYTLAISTQDFVLTTLVQDYGFSCPDRPRDLNALEQATISSKKNKYVFPCISKSGKPYNVIFKSKKAKSNEVYEKIHEIYLHTEE